VKLDKKLANKHMNPTHKGIRLLASGALVLSVIAVCSSLVGRAGASAGAAPPTAREINAAMNDTLAAILANDASTNLANDLPGAVNACFPIMHPDLALRQRLQDPAFRESQAAAFAGISDPVGVGMSLRATAEGQRQYEIDLQNILHPGGR
jgi:hypothetical protein